MGRWHAAALQRHCKARCNKAVTTRPRSWRIVGAVNRHPRLSYALQYAMDRKKLSPPQLARLIGKAPSTINRWLAGTSAPSLLDLVPLADALGVDPRLFVDPPPIPEYPIEQYLVRESVEAGIEEGTRRALERHRARGGR